MRPLSVGEILDAALKIYRRNFKTLSMAVLVLVVPLSILDTLITASTTKNAFDYTGTSTTVDSSGSFFAGALARLLLSVLTFSVATAACYHAVIRGYFGEQTTWQESLRYGISHLWRMLGLGLLALLGLIVPFVLLIVPGIWLAVRWSVAAPALLAEEIGPARALGRSFGLVKGRWWPTFGALICMYILISIAQFIVVSLMGVIFATSGSQVVVAVVLTILTAIASAITYPLQAAVFTLIYFDLRVRKEGFDLQLMAQRMGSGSAVPAPPGGIAGLGGDAPASPWGAPPAPAPAPAPAAPGGFLAPEAPDLRPRPSEPPPAA
jgi:hypothetical protein